MTQPQQIYHPPQQPITLADTAGNNSFTSINKFGSATDYVQIDNNGELSLNGNATVFKDLNVSGSALGTGPSAPTKVALNSTNIRGYSFNGTAITDELHGSFEIPHEYKEGSAIYPHLHWRTTTANAGNVKWQLEYSWLAAESIITGSTTISAIDPATGIAWQEIISTFPAISGTGKLIQGKFEFRLFRDPTDIADTYADGAYLCDIGFHYEVDAIGSKQITTK